MLIRERWPEMPIHLSVQANTVNAAAVRFWRQIGLTRVEVAVEAKQPYLLMGYKTPIVGAADETWEPYALHVLAAVLDGGARDSPAVIMPDRRLKSTHKKRQPRLPLNQYVRCYCCGAPCGAGICMPAGAGGW